MPNANIESRSDAFVGKVNRLLVDQPERKLPYANIPAALGAIALVETVYKDQDDPENAVGESQEVVGHLNGQSIAQIAMRAHEQDLAHLIGLKYSRAMLDTSIRRTAIRVADIIISGEHRDDVQTAVLAGEVVLGPRNIRDTIINLFEKGLIRPAQYTEGLLLLFEEVNPSQFDQQAVARVVGLTRTTLGKKISSGRHRYPTISQVVGGSQDGLEARSVSELIAAQREKMPKNMSNKAEGVVRSAIAHELDALFTPRR